MEAGFVIMIAVFTMVVGILIGMVIKKNSPTKETTQGVIYAYYHDGEDKPSLLLEGRVPVDEIASRKQVSFDVVVVKRNSQK